MEEQKKNQALVEVKNNSLKEISKRVIPKVADGLKGTGKVAGWGGLAFARNFCGYYWKRTYCSGSDGLHLQ